MPDTVRSFCADVYEYVKANDESPFLEKNAEIAAARIGVPEDSANTHDAMLMMEKTGVLPQLLLKRREHLDLNDDGDIDKEELESVLADPNSKPLDAIAAQYALTRFDKIRAGFDPFDWFENLEEGEIAARVMESREDPDMDPEEVYYGEVTKAPAIGALRQQEGAFCSETRLE